MHPGGLSDLLQAARAAERSGNWDQAAAWYEQALRAGGAEHAPALLRWIGTLRRESGDLEAAHELYEASLASAEALGLREHVAAGLNCVGVIQQARGELESAERTYAAAASLAEDLGDTRLGASVSQNQATLATVYGDMEVALRHLGRARESFRELGDDLAEAWVLNNMGMAYVELRAWEPAEACFRDAHRLAHAAGDRVTLSRVEMNLAEMNLLKRDFAQARSHCDEAFELCSRLRTREGVAEVDRLYGTLYRDTGRIGLAETHFARSVDAAQSLPDPLLEAEALQQWALLHWEMGRNREAFEALSSCHRIFTDLGARRKLLDPGRRLREIEEIYFAIVKAWGESIEAKDKYTAGHCERVAHYACSLAEAVGITGHDLTWFRMGAFLHDVGKIEVPAEVLNKPDRLTPEEWVLIQNHAAAGERIVAELGFPWDIRPMVRSHHERWDGSGYPDRLKGEKIPLHARILCVADVYDALTSTRSYKPAYSREEALRIMQTDAGVLLDPMLFKRFRATLDADPARLPLPA